MFVAIDVDFDRPPDDVAVVSLHTFESMHSLMLATAAVSLD